MKIITTMLVLCCLIKHVEAQTKVERSSKAEQFCASINDLYLKDYQEVGLIKEMKIQVVHVKNLSKGDSISYVKLVYGYQTDFKLKEKVAIIDFDELDEIIQSMAILCKSVIPTKKENFTEASFKTRTGIEVGSYFEKSVSNWVCYFKLLEYDRNSEIQLSSQEFFRMLTYIRKCKELV